MWDPISALFGEVEKAANIRGPKTTITVAKAYCTPSREYITGAFKPLGIRFSAPLFDTFRGKDPETGLPVHQTAKITVSKKAAAWAEYVIMRIKTPQGQQVFRVISKPKNEKNAQWAERHAGVPMPWKLNPSDVAWVIHDCPEAKKSGAQNASGKTASVKKLGGVIFTKDSQARARKPRSTRRRRRL